MKSQQQLLDSTITALYEAATHDEHWPVALAGLAKAFDSPRVAILRTTPNVDGIFEIRQINHDPEAQKLYQDYYWTLDPTLTLTRDAKQGVWYDCEPVLNPATTPQPEYVQYAIRHGIRFVAGGKVHCDETSCTIVGLQRPQDHRQFDKGSAAVFQRLAAHIGRAASLSANLRQAELSKGLSLAALDALDWPVYAVTSTGKLLLANCKGEAQLCLGSPFGLCNGSLHSKSPQANTELQEALRLAAVRQAGSSRVTHNATQWWVRTLPLAGYSGVTLLYVTRATGQAPSPALLRKVLNFSEAEAEVACLLADGHTIKEIACARKVSVWTVRAQVREIMHKAGVRRQVELSQMLMSLPLLRDA